MIKPRMIKKICFAAYFAVIAAFFSFPASAWALELDEAKKQGLVGETESGYLAAVSPPSAEVSQLVQKVNAARKEHYAAIAKENNTAVGAVEALAGKKATDLTPAGQFVQENGHWKKK